MNSLPSIEAMESYVLVTPVRDEASLLPRTIASVVAQTHLPAEWIIVSDGSSDGTDEIVRQAAKQYPWIRLLPLAARPERSFAAVALNTETGIRHLKSNKYSFLGLLDADVAFQHDYFEQLIARFELDPGLGLAGGVVIDVGLPKDQFPSNRIFVPGAVQFFRRACFERIGGLTPIPEGGWDIITCAMARLHGYQTRLFTDLVVDHLKPRNISEGGVVRRNWQLGIRDYATGYHPLFEVVKCFNRLKEPPFVIGALAWWIGYCTAVLQRRRRMVDSTLVDYMHHEQLRRIGRLLVP